MTRCPEYYDKWEKDPNWCNLCPSAVSQIDSYLEWVDLIEAAGGDRKFTFVKLTEFVSRELNQYKSNSPSDKKGIAKRLAEYINDPKTKRLDKIGLARVVGGVWSSSRLRRMNRMSPSIESQIKRNELLIIKYQKRIKELTEWNDALRRKLFKDTTHRQQVSDVVTVDPSNNDNIPDPQFFGDKPKNPGKPKVIGLPVPQAKGGP